MSLDDQREAFEKHRRAQLIQLSQTTYWQRLMWLEQARAFVKWAKAAKLTPTREARKPEADTASTAEGAKLT